ncbi:MAG TPA: hypothetical protein VFG12_18010 [Rhodopila sp.]|jgi:hypothetical protein|nr:hypothetical protein [Rhodopila sp.]
MTHTHTFILAPFVLAFLVSVFRFYNRENAASVASPSFLLAILSVLVAGSYLVLGVIDLLPSYSTIAYLLVGLAFLATAIARLFML